MTNEFKARIIKSTGRFFDCQLETREKVSAQALGNLLKSDEGLVVGDWVCLEKDDRGEYSIVKLLPRKNSVYRMLVREKKKKATASNIDLLVAIFSASSPAFKRGVLDRFLVRAYQWDIPALIIFNKMDEYNLESGLDLSFEKERLKNLDLECYEISAIESNYLPKYLDRSLKDLKEKLKNKTALFVGQSGVGKSQTITALSGGKALLRTGEVGKVGKGAHTTTWSEIIDLGDFYLMDSPGIRSFSIDDIESEELIIYFPDLAAIAGHCEFFNCQHLPESKGCAFWKQFDPLNSQHQPILDRLYSYQKMREEVSKTPLWEKK